MRAVALSHSSAYDYRSQALSAVCKYHFEIELTAVCNVKNQQWHHVCAKLIDSLHARRRRRKPESISSRIHDKRFSEISNGFPKEIRTSFTYIGLGYGDFVSEIYTLISYKFGKFWRKLRYVWVADRNFSRVFFEYKVELMSLPNLVSAW